MPTNATRVLAVDDREENLVALAAVLDALPVEVVTASSGRSALKELLNDDFALILLDVVMPEMDGFETAEHIKNRPRTRDVPIVFLTAAGEPGTGPEALRGYAAGAVDYLTKPFDPWLLRAKVSVFVELHRRNLQLRHQAAMLRRALTGGGPPAGDGLLGVFAERLGQVEGDVRRLRAAEAPPAGALTDLEAHVADLRVAFDALSADD
ncbi:response regulator [Actinomadura parmotrematis]|uniref:Response regulator n=1 Tax=Actinomadura parmotrematis TaxID=2864039 RepID=A0ABS7FUB6_9ACTN|nr:response regulator [Actinomadura parmotrematis]MBW8484004.1 response regulator [Actinomadura parmotrematis]